MATPAITVDTITLGIAVGANTPAALAQMFDADPRQRGELGSLLDAMALSGRILIEPNDVHTIHLVPTKAR